MIINLKNQSTNKEIGKKATTLNKLWKLGYPICDGYSLCTSFWKDFCKHNKIKNHCKDIEYRIQTGMFTKTQQNDLKTVFNLLKKKTGAVIVRSSALEEDGISKSCAGVFESILSVTSVEQMASAIKQVWCSYYRNGPKYGIRPSLRGMPVLIQEMLFCTRAGVAFTKNPVSGHKELVIEMTKGNNHTIISGIRKAQQIIIDEKKTTQNGIFRKSTIKSLLELAQRLEKDMGYPCDFEWGIWRGNLFLFQVRPITVVIKSEPYQAPENNTVNCVLLDRYASPASVCYLSLLELWQEKVYLSYYSKKPGRTYQERPLYFLYNRVYWNLEYQKKYFEDRGEKNLIKRIQLNKLIRKGYQDWYQRLEAYKKTIQKNQRKLETEKPKELLMILQEVIDCFYGFIGIDHFRFLGIAQILYRKLEDKIKKEGNQNRYILDTVGGDRYKNKTLQANYDLTNIAEYIAGEPELCIWFLKTEEDEIALELLQSSKNTRLHSLFKSFLAEHGHRGIECDDLYYPHWRECPQNVILLIKEFIKTGTYKQKEKPSSQIPHKKYQKLIYLTGEYMCLRENQRYYFDMSWVLIRSILLKLSKHLIQRKLIHETQDIFHLTIDEIQEAVLFENYRLKDTVLQTRKKNYQMAKEMTPPYILKNSEQVVVQKNEDRKSYKATGISYGTASGEILIVNRVEELENVKSDDIIVVKTFHPSWTPILKVVSGIIMSYGNMLSHGAVVAREYGIPVVVFNGDASRYFRNGDRVEMNGTTGRIRFLNKVKR